MSGSKKISDKNSASFRGCTKPPALQVDSLLNMATLSPSPALQWLRKMAGFLFMSAARDHPTILNRWQLL